MKHRLIEPKVNKKQMQMSTLNISFFPAENIGRRTYIATSNGDPILVNNGETSGATVCRVYWFSVQSLLYVVPIILKFLMELL